MAIALLQTQTSSKTSSAGTTSTSSLSTTTTGSTVIIVACADAAATAKVTSITCTGMTFTKIDDIGGASCAVSLWYAFNNTGATTPTLTLNWASTTIGGAIIREYSGLTTTDPLDKHTLRTNAASNTPNSGATATQTGSNDLVVGYAGTLDSGNTYTAGAGYANARTLVIGTTLDLGMEDLTLSGSTAAQTATFTITNSDTNNCGVSTFLAASSVAQNSVPGNMGRYFRVGDGMSRGEVAN